ncbi:MAG: Tad domain-containing protein, partial [Actinomycetia bacterium]|nr:Tad domain-containing protein [Actinomycetes bacterium]
MRCTWLRAVVPSRDDQSGSVTPFVLIVTIALFMLAGLVIDGGRHLSSRSRAFAYAQEASRAGAQTIKLNRDIAILDKDKAVQAAERFCGEAMSRDQDLVKCDAEYKRSTNEAGIDVISIEVTTTVETDAILSGMFGMNTWEADGRARARPVQGIVDPQTGQQFTIGPPESADPTDNPFGTDTGPPPTEDVTPSCKSPYYDPYDLQNTWSKGDPPLEPPITESEPTEPVPCWPAWPAPT